MAVNIFDQVRNFLAAPSLDEALGALAHNPPQPPIRTSWVWDSHVISESAGGGKGKLPQTASVSWDENEARGIESSMRSWQGLSPRERKEILLAIYLANSTVSACVDVIANRICSGGFTVEKINEEAKDNQQHYDQLMEFCLRVNDDWDFLQYARASITDQLIFGETYTEILWQAGIPYQLAKVDCITMHYRINRSGLIQEYQQQLTSSSEINHLDPKDIIRWWRPHPRAAIDPFSPIEKVQDAVNLDKKMVNWITMFFQKGAKFPYTVEFPGERDEAERFLAWFRQNYTGEKNAHLPPVTWGGAKINATGKGSLEVDFPGGRDRNRTEILSAYHVPPAAISIIESGNIGGGTGEDQDKSLQYNACDPVKGAWLEKFNYRITKRGFKIDDYRIGLRYADFRSDESLAKVADTRVRNGTRTINETRSEEGRRPYKDGGDTPIVVASKDIIPVPRFDTMGDEQAQQMQQQLDQGDLNTELLKTKVDQAKNPPVMTPGQQLPNQQGATNAKNTQGVPAKSQPAQKAKGNAKSQKSEEEASGSAERGLFLLRNQYNTATAITVRNETPHAPVQESDGSRRGESIDAQPTQPPAHQQSDARLASFTQATISQESTTAAGEVRGTATEAGKDHFTGMMLAFMLDPETAKKLAIPDGETADNLHITLAYLGDTEDEITDDKLRPHTSPFKIRDAVSMVASHAKPLTGNVGGVGRFFPAETEETPIIALVDVPGLVEFRNKLVETVEAAGYFVANNHGYTPHITLSYIDANAPMPIKSVPPLPLTLDTVWLCVGDERIPFPLKIEQQSVASFSTQEDDSDNDQQSDRDKLIAALIALFLMLQSGKFSTDAKNRMVDLLAKAYLVAYITAYKSAFQAIGSDAALATWDMAAIKQWAAEQVDSITSTFEEMFRNANPATPEEAKQFIDNLVTWKPQQIANYTLSSGANSGTGTAVDDMLEALTSVDIDTSLIPDGLSADQIRIRVVPEESSSDFCSEWAGKDFALEDAGDIPFFPSHPSCIHSIEVYVAGGDDA